MKMLRVVIVFCFSGLLCTVHAESPAYTYVKAEFVSTDFYNAGLIYEEGMKGRGLEAHGYWSFVENFYLGAGKTKVDGSRQGREIDLDRTHYDLGTYFSVGESSNVYISIGVVESTAVQDERNTTDIDNSSAPSLQAGLRSRITSELELQVGIRAVEDIDGIGQRAALDYLITKHFAVGISWDRTDEYKTTGLTLTFIP